MQYNNHAWVQHFKRALAEFLNDLDLLSSCGLEEDQCQRVRAVLQELYTRVYGPANNLLQDIAPDLQKVGDLYYRWNNHKQPYERKLTVDELREARRHIRRRHKYPKDAIVVGSNEIFYKDLLASFKALETVASSINPRPFEPTLRLVLRYL